MDPISYPGSRNPLRTSYVKQDGESIKRKGDEAKREQFTSRFNDTNKAHNSNAPKAHKRNIRIKPDTRQHLNGFTLMDRRLPQTFTQTPKKEKGVATSLFVVAGESSLPRPSAWSRLAPDTSRGWRTLSGTSRPVAPVLCATGAVASLSCLLRFGRSPSQPLFGSPSKPRTTPR